MPAITYGIYKYIIDAYAVTSALLSEMKLRKITDLDTLILIKHLSFKEYSRDRKIKVKETKGKRKERKRKGKGA
jgi:hypothetical protein